MRDALAELETVRDDLRNALENTPENFQSGEWYAADEQCAESFDEAAADLDSAIATLDDWL